MAENKLPPLLLGNNRLKGENNSCYVNSVAQVLRNNPKFVDILHKLPDKTLVEQYFFEIIECVGVPKVTTTMYFRYAVGRESAKRIPSRKNGRCDGVLSRPYFTYARNLSRNV